jgi:hypothetical protein
MAKIIEVSTTRFENGLYALAFDGVVKGDCAKFDTAREARIAAFSWNGKESGCWDGSTWVETVYKTTEG